MVVIRSPVNTTKGDENMQFADLMKQKDAQIAELKRELQNCRDELCLKCGSYREAHKGACDGCRFKDIS